VLVVRAFAGGKLRDVEALDDMIEELLVRCISPTYLIEISSVVPAWLFSLRAYAHG
jgi:hypothetical protein